MKLLFIFVDEPLIVSIVPLDSELRRFFSSSPGSSLLYSQLDVEILNLFRKDTRLSDKELARASGVWVILVTDGFVRSLYSKHLEDHRSGFTMQK